MKKDHFEKQGPADRCEPDTLFGCNAPTMHDPVEVSHLNILVIEDNFADYDDICRMIRHMTHFDATVVCARNLEEARHALKGQTFDLALVDYCLGAESGARFLREIGGRGGTIAAILLTSLLTKEPQEIAMQAGAVGCLCKDDLSPQILETTIRYSLYTHMLEKKFRDVVDQLSLNASGARQQHHG